MSYPFIASMMDRNPKAEIARLVKAGRVGKGYTQQELSDIVGISLRSIQRIENAEVLPRLYTLTLLAQHLGFSPEIPSDSEPSFLDKPIPQSSPGSVPFNGFVTQWLNHTQKIILSFGIGIVLALLLAAFLAQSSRFPETGFEFLLLLVSVIGGYMLTLLVIWN